MIINQDNILICNLCGSDDSLTENKEPKGYCIDDDWYCEECGLFLLEKDKLKKARKRQSFELDEEDLIHRIDTLYWTTQNEGAIRIKDMTDLHILNCIKFTLGRIQISSSCAKFYEVFIHEAVLRGIYIK